MRWSLNYSKIHATRFNRSSVVEQRVYPYRSVVRFHSVDLNLYYMLVSFISLYTIGCILSLGRIIYVSNNLKYLVLPKKLIFAYSITSWLGLSFSILNSIAKCPYPLQEPQPWFQFKMMQRYSSGERIYDCYNSKFKN